MTNTRTPAPLRTALPAAALAALLLAGCSTGHIGESWQCPLAEGGSCGSVAAADPAVPDPGVSDGTVLAGPLWRMRDAGAPAASAETPPARGPGQACAAECDGGFDPFGWLARLFGAPGSLAGAAGGASGDRAAPADAMAKSAGLAAETPAPAGAAVREAGGSGRSAAGPGSRAPEPAPAALPAPGSRVPVPASEPGGQALGPAQDEPDAGDLRTGEVVARIWIAPFVDANGVYREASHVRVVLESAGWRLK